LLALACAMAFFTTEKMFSSVTPPWVLRMTKFSAGLPWG
jgi:hypothetical protein